jgi:hypothetical protein
VLRVACCVAVAEVSAGPTCLYFGGSTGFCWINVTCFMILNSDCRPPPHSLAGDITPRINQEHNACKNFIGSKERGANYKALRLSISMLCCNLVPRRIRRSPRRSLLPAASLFPPLLPSPVSQPRTPARLAPLPTPLSLPPHTSQFHVAFAMLPPPPSSW